LRGADEYGGELRCVKNFKNPQASGDVITVRFEAFLSFTILRT